MQHLVWGKLVVGLVAVVAVLQVVHLILLSRLQSKHHHVRHTIVRHQVPEQMHAHQVETVFGNLVRTLEQSRVLDSSGEYQVVSGIAAALKQPHPHRIPTTAALLHLSLVTQCSFQHLHYLVSLAQRWQGPISVAVFAEDDQISDALWSVAGLRSCFVSILHNVSFSLVSPLPAKSSPPIAIPSTRPLTGAGAGACSNWAKPRTKPNYASTYPGNLLRNVARRATPPSHFVLLIDIDMLPNDNLRQDFLDLASERGLLEREDKTVFVVPAFEVAEATQVAEAGNKAQLLKRLQAGHARPFYSQLCWKCQVHTDYEAWQKELPSAELAPLFEVLWKDPWEPFYIARNTVPFYDERFKQYGFNRISQVCELHVAGYKFSVLNNAFVVHRGFKTATSFHVDKEQDQERNRILFRQFKMELKSKYPESSRRCY